MHPAPNQITVNPHADSLFTTIPITEYLPAFQKKNYKTCQEVTQKSTVWSDKTSIRMDSDYDPDVWTNRQGI